MDIYAGVAASLAERKKGSQLTEFFRNIKGTIDDDDWDQVTCSSSNVSTVIWQKYLWFLSADTFCEHRKVTCKS